MRFGVFLTLLLCFAGSFAATAATPKKSVATVKSKDMNFQIMRASKPECEPNCPEWIYAEGEIIAGTPAKFNQILRIAGKSTLPLVIQSGGGDVRLLGSGRSRQTRRSRFGTSQPKPCIPAWPERPKRQGRAWEHLMVGKRWESLPSPEVRGGNMRVILSGEAKVGK